MIPAEELALLQNLQCLIPGGAEGGSSSSEPPADFALVIVHAQIATGGAAVVGMKNMKAIYK